MLSLLVGQYTPSLVRLVLRIFLSQRASKIYEKLVEPSKNQNYRQISSAFYSINIVQKTEILQFILSFL
ncbi:MAG: hypothetical protein BRC52_01070 [Cyanobacteria bacterium SW_5_48_44]|nr:MAG: hypothetical protein BRC52_01070 [Cyanobacteria bacterium SW_5_48_44]